VCDGFSHDGLAFTALLHVIFSYPKVLVDIVATKTAATITPNLSILSNRQPEGDDECSRHETGGGFDERGG
jgi:hypothetical protein